VGAATFRAAGQSDVTVALPAGLLVEGRRARLTLAGSGTLAPGAVWRLLLPPGALLDVAGNAYRGVSDGEYSLQT